MTDSLGESPVVGGNLGLSGWVATFANLSAVVLIGVMFWIQTERAYKTAQEDRALCHAESQRQWDVVRQGQEAIFRLTRSVEELGTQVRAIREKQEKTDNQK